MIAADRPKVVSQAELEPIDPDALHYVKKAHITESIVNGIEVVAVCGERFVVASGRNVWGNGSQPVCRRCAAIYALMT